MISRSVLVCLVFALKTVKCTEPVRVTGELPSADTIDYGVDLDAAGGGYGRSFGGYGGLGFGNGNGFGYGSDIALGPGIGYSGGYGGHGVGRFRGYKGHGNGLGYGGYGGFGGLGGYKGYRNFGGLGRGYGGYGGSLYGGGVEKSGFVKGGSSVNDGNYQKGAGHKGQVSERTAEGISSGQASEKDAKGETGHYSDSGADKKGYEDKKAYSGGSHYDSSGAKGGEHKASNGHKKGRLTKGFESSHHKDEVAKTTTFFDEENDEGDRYDYGGSHGKYGDKSSGSYHSGRQNDKYDANQYAKKGHFDQGHAKGKENADKLAYGNKVYYDNNNQYGETGGADHQSILGHAEANKVYKHHPYYY